jgi:hypothetical protein
LRCESNGIKNIHTFIEAKKEIGTEVYVEKTKYMVICRQTAGKNWAIKITNKSFENLSEQIFGNDGDTSPFYSKGI